MNKHQLEVRKKEVRLLIRQGYRNVLKCSSGKAESDVHKYLKYRLAKYCWNHNLDFQTEVTWRDGSGRCDFVCENWMVGVEVLCTETTKKFYKKQYPLPVVCLKIGATLDISRLDDMLDELNNTSGDSADFYIRKSLEK